MRMRGHGWRVVAWVALCALLVGPSPGAGPVQVQAALSSNETDFNDEQRRTILILATAVSLVSLPFSFAIILSYRHWTELRSVSLHIICFLACADIGAALSYIVTTPGVVFLDAAWACYAQALLLTFFQLASVLWTTAVAITLYRAVVLRRQTLNYTAQYWNRVLRFYHAYCWGIPLLVAVLPTFTESYGKTGGWCWIQTDADSKVDAGVFWRLAFYLPIWSAIAFNAFAYTATHRALVVIAHEDDTSSAQLSTLAFKLKYYLLVLIVCWGPGTANRIVNFVAPSSDTFLLYCFQVVFQQSAGMCNAIVYGMNPAVRSRLKSLVIDDAHDASHTPTTATTTTTTTISSSSSANNNNAAEGNPHGTGAESDTPGANRQRGRIPAHRPHALDQAFRYGANTGSPNAHDRLLLEDDGARGHMVHAVGADTDADPETATEAETEFGGAGTGFDSGLESSSVATEGEEEAEEASAAEMNEPPWPSTDQSGPSPPPPAAPF